MKEVWNFLSENPILSGVSVLFIGFICKGIFSLFREKEEPTIEIHNYIGEHKNPQIKKEEYKNELNTSEKEIFRDLSVFFLKIEEKIALFHSICGKDDYKEQLKEFNLWQYDTVKEIRIKIKSDVDISKRFENIALSLLGSIMNTYELFYSSNILEYTNKIHHIDLYYKDIKEKYEELRDFKN